MKGMGLFSYDVVFGSVTKEFRFRSAKSISAFCNAVQYPVCPVGTTEFQPSLAGQAAGDFRVL
jgi:hypothetical protein